MRPIKTSGTHPLPLAAVNVPNSLGRILFTMCPGKIQPHADTGPWDRDLEADMDAILEAGTTTIITLMEAHEIEACALSLERIGDASAARDLAWHHCPIPDFHAPTKTWEQAWCEIGPTVRQNLRDGKTLLLHCRGGRGQAGLVAARLLVELGLPADEAISQVRAARPEAIETAVQEEHVRTISPIT